MFGAIIVITVFLLFDLFPTLRDVLIPKYVKHGKRPYRDLEEWEKEYLRDYVNINYFSFRKKYRRMGIVLGIAMFAPVVIFLSIQNNDIGEPVFDIAVYGVVIVSTLWAAYMTRRMNVQQDLSSPVHIELATVGQGLYGDDYYSFNKRITNLLATNPQYHDVVQNLTKRDRAAFEYSPRTKFVWRVIPLSSTVDDVKDTDKMCYVQCKDEAVCYRLRDLEESEKILLIGKKRSQNTWDSENPVYVVRGYARVKKQKRSIDIHICGMSFATSKILDQDLRKKVERLSTCTLSLEFSPFTQNIWKIDIEQESVKRDFFSLI